MCGGYAHEMQAALEKYNFDLVLYDHNFSIQLSGGARYSTESGRVIL
jgi:hypothetical protein